MSTVYDLKTKRRSPLSRYLGGRKGLHCVGDVKGKTGLAFFTTSQGTLELRDITHHKTLRTWRGITNVSSASLSPDKTILAIQPRRVWEFWKFRPRWLAGATAPQHRMKRRSGQTGGAKF